jgi:hypothetical protein
MTAAQSETVPVEAEDPAVIGGEAHGELRCYDCGPPVESFPLFALTGVIIGLIIIGILALRRSLRRRRR